MSWKASRISTSLLGILWDSSRASETLNQVEHIREEMLDCMDPFLAGKVLRPAVWAKVQYASDIQSLWFLRCDVMQMLADHCGEYLAAQKLDELTALFRGHIPRAQFASSKRRR
jgi:hypothetical protein